MTTATPVRDAILAYRDNEINSGVCCLSVLLRLPVDIVMEVVTMEAATYSMDVSQMQSCLESLGYRSRRTETVCETDTESIAVLPTFGLYRFSYDHRNYPDRYHGWLAAKAGGESPLIFDPRFASWQTASSWHGLHNSLARKYRYHSYVRRHGVGLEVSDR